MRKFNKVLVVVLAVVLLIMCAVPPTFSWFTRPKSQNGASLKWDGIMYDANSDVSGLSIKTTQSNDGTTFETIDGKQGKNYADALSTRQVSLGSGSIQYYCTEITNSSDADKSVSLYIPDIDTKNRPFYLGVNDPARTYKLYGATVTPTSGTKVASTINKQNVYIGIHSLETTDLCGKLGYDGYIHAWDSSGVTKDQDVYYEDWTNTNKTGEWGIDGFWNGGNQTYNIYAATINLGHTHFMLHCNGNWYNDAQLLISSNNTLLYYEYGTYYTVARTSGAAAKLKTFYSSAAVKKGSTLNISADGSNLTYSSDNESIATVDTSGNIRGVDSGSCTITVTSKGVYGDTITATCKVTVNDDNTTTSNYSDIPIVTNYLIPKATTDENGASVPTKCYVYWYIKNSYTGSSGNLTYTLDKIALTL